MEPQRVNACHRVRVISHAKRSISGQKMETVSFSRHLKNVCQMTSQLAPYLYSWLNAMEPLRGKCIHRHWRLRQNVGDRGVVPVENGREIARILYRGMYLTGFLHTRKNVVYAVDISGNEVECSTFLQVLTWAHQTDYSWLGYELGEPIPLSAVVVGYWQGAPIYVVSATFNSRKSGYYNPVTEQLYIPRGQGRTATNIWLLVENQTDWRNVLGIKGNRREVVSWEIIVHRIFWFTISKFKYSQLFLEVDAKEPIEEVATVTDD